jgi:hypothetical protein
MALLPNVGKDTLRWVMMLLFGFSFNPGNHIFSSVGDSVSYYSPEQASQRGFPEQHYQLV